MTAISPIAAAGIPVWRSTMPMRSGTNTVATFGAYYLRDEIAFVPSDNEGAYGQLAYKDTDFETFGRLKLDQIGYLGHVSSATRGPNRAAFRAAVAIRRAARRGCFGLHLRPAGAHRLLWRAGRRQSGLLPRRTSKICSTGTPPNSGRPAACASICTRPLVVDAGWRVNARQVEDRQVRRPVDELFRRPPDLDADRTLSFVAEVDRGFVEPVSSARGRRRQDPLRRLGGL